MNYKRIVIAVDESKYSVQVAKKGFELAQTINAEVTLLNIIAPIEPIGTIDSVILPIDPTPEEIENSNLLLAGYEKDFAGSVKPIKIVKISDPPVEILKYAKEWEADIIVIGRHGLESFSHLLFGGVVDYIATHTKIPVMLVP
jgi:nucleotide-binding universal stress UspA family protein